MSFLDADRTCDPNIFAELCRALDEKQAHLCSARAWGQAAMLSSLLVVGAVMLGVTTFLMHMLELIAAQRGDLRSSPPPDRIRPARRAAS